MWQPHIYACAYIVMLCQSIGAQQYDSRFEGSISDTPTHRRQQRTSEQLQLELKSWSPLSEQTQQNNWFILQATASSSSSVQHQPRKRLPVNYYAYNQRYNQSNIKVGGSSSAGGGNGNYKLVRPSADNYVLAISQARQPAQLADNWLTKEAYAVPPEADKAAAAANNADDAASDEVSDEADESLSLEGYLAPIERALIKVRNFCNIVESFISDDEDEQLKEKMEPQLAVFGHGQQQQQQPMAAASPELPATTSKEVQGQHQHSSGQMPDPRARSLSIAASNGRGMKRLRKRLRKFLVPLLLAYKLKFLTLIPVLIGGLTLLVGTTGVAGFFFALFTAVMSLKATGHVAKSLVVKKL